MARPKAASPKPKPKPKPKSKAPRSSKSSPETYTDPDLRDRLKAEIMAGEKGGQAGQWSARKSQLLAAAYKKAGGGYKEGKKTGGQEDLDRWSAEHWTTRDGKPAVRDGETSRYLPESAWAELTPAQKTATDSKKKAASRSGRQFVANTGPAKAARKKASAKKARPKS